MGDGEKTHEDERMREPEYVRLSYRIYIEDTVIDPGCSTWGTIMILSFNRDN